MFNTLWKILRTLLLFIAAVLFTSFIVFIVTQGIPLLFRFLNVYMTSYRVGQWLVGTSMCLAIATVLFIIFRKNK